MKFSKWIENKTGRFLLFTLGLSIGATLLTVTLFLNLRPDIEELLPLNSPSLVDWNILRGQIRSTDFLAVLIQHPDLSTRTQVADELTQRLRDRKDPVIADVDAGPGDLQKWGERHGAFLVPLAVLQRLESLVRQAIRTERFSDEPFEVLKKERESAKVPAARFDSAPDQTSVVMVHLTPEGSRMQSGFALKKAVAEELGALSMAVTTKIRYTGPVEILAEEHDALIEDLNMSALLTVLLCGALMVFFFGSLSFTTALLAALGVGVVCTFAFGFIAVGYVNSNTAFLASIVVGNGVNFGIMFLARFMEERRANPQGDWATQLDIAQQGTWKGTWTAALAAGLAYGSLLMTDFRGFQQFALMGLVGMILCWLSSVTVLPALILHFRKRLSANLPRMDPGHGLGRFLRQPAVPALLMVIFAGMTALASYRYAQGSALSIETDLNRVRNSESMVSGAGSLVPVMERATGSRAPILVWAPTAAALQGIEKELNQAIQPGGPLHGLVDRILSPAMILPEDQEAKAATLKKLRSLLPKELLDFIPAKQREPLTQFLNSQPVAAADLPLTLRSAFQDRSGQVGKILYVEPAPDSHLLAENRLITLTRGLREILGRYEGRMAGQLPVAADIVLSIEKDGPRATLFALLAVILLVIVSFRKISAVFPLLAGLCLAVLWLVGGMSLLGLRLNFINFIALPITFGIGVDYSVNLFQRYLGEREGGKQRRPAMIEAVTHAGGAVLMASLTTVIGYGSLLIARNQGFVSLGWVAVIGELTCLTSAMLLLPSIVLLRKDA